MKTAFNSLLEFAGVPIERNGGSRTLYSLRHFYVVMRLPSDNFLCSLALAFSRFGTDNWSIVTASE